MNIHSIGVSSHVMQKRTNSFTNCYEGYTLFVVQIGAAQYALKKWRRLTQGPSHVSDSRVRSPVSCSASRHIAAGANTEEALPTPVVNLRLTTTLKYAKAAGETLLRLLCSTIPVGVFAKT